MLHRAFLVAAITVPVMAQAEGFDAGLASCPAFVAAMTAAQAQVGTPDLDPYRQYLLGFQKGYSWQAPSPIEVFAPLGDPPIAKALDAIAVWCGGNAQATSAE